MLLIEEPRPETSLRFALEDLTMIVSLAASETKAGFGNVGSVAIVKSGRAWFVVKYVCRDLQL